MTKQIISGIFPETFKLTAGHYYYYPPQDIEKAGSSISLKCAKNDWTACQVVVWMNEDYAVSVGNSEWVSQTGFTNNLRFAAEMPFPCQVNIEGMMMDDDRFLKADILLSDPILEVKAKHPTGIWVEMQVPADAQAGSYSGKVLLYEKKGFEAEQKIKEFAVELEVVDYVMPAAEDSRFYLDLWQHNSNLARKAEVPLWSDEHFEVMERYVKTLGALGQKTVTLVMSEVPWAGQSCFHEIRDKGNLFEYSIVPIERDREGKFHFDFSLAQRYIDLCAKYGIRDEISLYGLANVVCEPRFEFVPTAPDYPDSLHVRYFDAADGCYKYMTKAEEIDQYLKAIEEYFITTGQIDRVRLAADEPDDVEKYRKSLEHIREIAPSFKFKAALNHVDFIKAFGEEVSDFVPWIQPMCEEYDKLMEYKRTMKGKRFLWYVCCGPDFPNSFLVNHLTEIQFFGVLTSYAGLDGFLRWSYTIWNDSPREDIRFGIWRAGDTHLVYPAKNGYPLLSLRYKMMLRAVQQFNLLERLKETAEKEVVQEAFDIVVREKDIRKYYKEADTLEKMCSVNGEDYEKLKFFVIEYLMKNKK